MSTLADTTSTLSATLPAECPHGERQLRKRVTANGGVQFVHQCITCGQAAQPVAHSSLTAAEKEQAPPFDGCLQGDFWRSAFEERQRAHEERTLERRERYQTYLQSDGWRAIRLPVLRRAAGHCEGCGKSSALEIHHLTYDHACDPFLFELVALCRSCHRRLHFGQDES